MIVTECNKRSSLSSSPSAVEQNNMVENAKKTRQCNRKKTSAATAARSHDGVTSQHIDPPDIDAILNRDDFVITNPTRYKFVYTSNGPPRAEVHLVTTAHIVLPDSKLACKLSDDVIPDLVQARTEVMKKDAEDAEKEKEREKEKEKEKEKENENEKHNNEEEEKEDTPMLTKNATGVFSSELGN